MHKTILAIACIGFIHAAQADEVEKSEGAEKADETDRVVEVDTAAGEELFKKTCKNCHGPKAQGMASYPKLSDKDVETLVERLEKYRAGEKIGANSALMFPHAKKLSDEDITNIAAYIVTLAE